MRKPTSLVIHGGRVLTPAGFTTTDLAIEAGTVSKIGSGGGGDTTIDADGLLVAPGLIDIQVNGGFGHDFTADPSVIWEVGARLPATGVTSFLPTIVTSPPSQRERAMEVLAGGPPRHYRGALPLGLHFEGPMLAPTRRGTHQLDHLRPPSPAQVEGWSREAGVLLVTLAPELAGADAIIRTLLERGVVVAAGHSEATFEEGELALRSGVSHGTHLFNSMPPFEPRRPGLVGTLLADLDASVAIICDGVHLHPGTVQMTRLAKGPGRVALITDAMAGMGAGPGEYPLSDLTITVDGTSARNPDGNLAGSILTLDQAVRNYRACTGCPPEEALAAASTNPARVIGESSRGVIEVGRVADLVLVDEQLNVQVTVIAGSPAHVAEGAAGRVVDGG